ncbi:MAG: hypothetical protein ACKO3I_04555 [Synechococcales cyanobacterium]|nr:hypothetical protein [Cyanobacteria bacterium REEB444]
MSELTFHSVQPDNSSIPSLIQSISFSPIRTTDQLHSVVPLSISFIPF